MSKLRMIHKMCRNDKGEEREREERERLLKKKLEESVINLRFKTTSL